MQDLIKRIEAADGPDRELDEDIALSLGIVMKRLKRGEWEYPDGTSNGLASYTSSIDAAMTLGPDGWAWTVGTHGEDDVAWACVTSPLDADENGGCKDYTAHAETPALALCAAALRSRNG